jgi:uncharacterized membrane protein YbhN (UPF0104 family)
VASVIIDRALNVAAYLSYLPFAWSLFHPFPGSPDLSLALLPLLQKTGSIFHRFWDRLVQAFSAWARQPKTVVSALVISWFSILVVLAGVWFIAIGLGMRVSLLQVMGVSVITYLVTLLPISMNGYGLREVTETSLYISAGATLEQSLALVLITRFFMLIETLPGAIWLSQILAGHKLAPETDSSREANRG